MYRVLIVVLFIFTVYSDSVYAFENIRNMRNPQISQWHRKKSHHHRYDDVEFVPHRLRQIKYHVGPCNAHSIKRRLRKSPPNLMSEDCILLQPTKFIRRIQIAGERTKPPAAIRKQGPNEYNVITRLPQPMRTKIILNNLKKPAMRDIDRVVDDSLPPNIHMTTQDYINNMLVLQDVMDRNRNNLLRYRNRVLTTTNSPYTEERMVTIIEKPSQSATDPATLDSSELPILEPDVDQTGVDKELDQESDYDPSQATDVPQNDQPSHVRVGFKKDQHKPAAEAPTNLTTNNRMEGKTLTAIRTGRFKIHKLPVHYENEDEEAKEPCYRKITPTCCQPSQSAEKKPSSEFDEYGDEKNVERKSYPTEAETILQKRFFHFGRKTELNAKPNTKMGKLEFKTNELKKVTHRTKGTTIGSEPTVGLTLDTHFPASYAGYSTSKSPVQGKKSLFSDMNNLDQMLQNSIKQVESLIRPELEDSKQDVTDMQSKISRTFATLPDYTTNSYKFWDDDLEQQLPPKPLKTALIVQNSDFPNKVTTMDVNRPLSKFLQFEKINDNPRLFEQTQDPIRSKSYNENTDLNFGFDPIYSRKEKNKLLDMYESVDANNERNDFGIKVKPLQCRSHSIPVEPKYDTIFNRVEPKGSNDLYNVSKISFHPIPPKQHMYRPPSSNVAFLSNYEGAASGEPTNQLRMYILNVKPSERNEDVSNELKRSMQEDHEQESKERLEKNSPTQSQNTHDVIKPLNRKMKNQNGMLSGTYSPETFRDLGSTAPYKFPSHISNSSTSLLSNRKLNPPDHTSFPVPYARVTQHSLSPDIDYTAEDIQDSTLNMDEYSEDTECTTQATDNATTPQATFDKPDEPDYDADENKCSPCTQMGEYLQEHKLNHLREQLKKYEAKEKFYESERLQMEADALNSLVPMKEKLVACLEDMDRILKKILCLHPVNPHSDNPKVTKKKFDLLLEALSYSECTIKRIADALERIAENGTDLKEETKIGLDEARLRMSGISNRLIKEKRKIEAARKAERESHVFTCDRKPAKSKRKNKKYRLFRWKRLLQNTIDTLEKL